MRDNGGRTDTLRDSLESLIMRLKTHTAHLEDGCGAPDISVEQQYLRRQTSGNYPKKTKQTKKPHLSDFMFMLFVCTVVITPQSPSTATEGQNDEIDYYRLRNVFSLNHKSGFQY